MSSAKDQSDDLTLTPLSAPKAIPEDTSDVGFGEDGMPLNPSGGEPGVTFTSPGRDPANGDAKVEIGSTGVPHFVGLGKEELMKFANDPFWVRLRWILFALFWLIWLAMLVGAIVIIVLAPKCANKALTTGQTEVAANGPYYQIFLKSFSPNGKFSGLEQKTKYIKDLGVKTVIVSQFVDTNGKGLSEVINFDEVDPSYGLDFEGFKKSVKTFKDAGLNIILQFIPNHSSKLHPWFNSKPSYYVLKKKSEVEKSTWVTSNGDKAWSVRNASDPEGDYYLHQFKETEADLNFKNPDVVKEMNNILKKWYSTGVDGFLLSDVSFLSEDLDNLEKEDSTKNQKDNMEIVEAITDKKDWDVEKDRTPYTLVDVNDLNTDQIFETYSKDNVVPVVAEWATLSTDFNETQLLKASESSEFALRRLSSPRLPRIESRFGSSRAKILAMVTFLLRGEVILYYGDEIGMTSSRQGKGDFNIDPMDWRAAESTTPTSEFYKNLIKIHNEMNQTQKDGGSTKFYTEAGVFAFKRETAKKFVVVTNVGGEKKVINIKKELDTTKKATVVSVTPGLVTPAKGDNVTMEEIALPPESGVVLELIPDEE